MIRGLLVALAAAVPAHAGTDLFASLLHKEPAEVDQRIAAAWRQLFHGDPETQRIYFQLPDGTAYVADVANQDTRTEGLSYAMMIAVQLGHREEFERIWAFSKQHLLHRQGPLQGYFAWHADFRGRPLSEGPAPDGEEWYATALLLAGQRWSAGYAREARAILHAMRHKHEQADRGETTDLFDPASRLVVFAPGGEAATFTDPSYQIPQFYELWARSSDDPADRDFWRSAAAAARKAWEREADPKTGLMPDYAEFDGKPHERHGMHGLFAYDAWRTLAYPALDWAGGSGDRWEPMQSNRVLTFLSQYGAECPNRFRLDGAPVSQTSSPGMAAMAAVAGLAADPDVARPFVQRFWDAPIPTGRGRYYDGMLTLLGLLEVSGRFRLDRGS